MIEILIIMNRSKRKLGLAPIVLVVEIVEILLYKLKREMHWSLLPLQVPFPRLVLSWRLAYRYCQKLCLLKFLKHYWVKLHKVNKGKSNLLVGSYYGCFILAFYGDEEVEFPDRNRSKTLNTQYLKKSLRWIFTMLQSMRETITADLQKQFQIMPTVLKKSQIHVINLFSKAYTVFDSKGFRVSYATSQINDRIYFNNHNESEDYVNKYFDQNPHDKRYGIKGTTRKSSNHLINEKN